MSEILRASILDELARWPPTVLRVIAPAGFGKSTLVRQYAATFARTAICDCAPGDDPSAFARSVVTALAAEAPDRASELAEELLLAGTEAQATRALALRAWCVSGPPSLFVFENAETLAADETSQSFLANLVSRPHPSRRLAIVSRRPLRIRLGRYAAPNDVLEIGADRLRFSREELETAVIGRAFTPAQIEAIFEASQGWPFVALLVARLGDADRGLLERFDRLRAFELEDLFEYVAHELIGSLEASSLDALMVTAVVKASLDDVRAVTGDARNARRNLRGLVPLIATTAAETFEAHPLVRAVLRDRFPERLRDVAVRVCVERAERGDAIGAARAYLDAGDRDRAAAMLEGVAPFMIAQPSVAMADVLASIDRPTLMRHPGAWSTSVVATVFTIDAESWLREAETVWRSLDETTAPIVAAGVLSSLINAYTNLGRFDEALQCVSDGCARIRPHLPDVADQTHVFWTWAVDVWRGGRHDIGEFAARIPLLLEHDATRALWTYDMEARLHRMNGDRARERASLERALELAARCGLATVSVICTLDAAFGAWFAGEDEACEAYADAMVTHSGPLVAPGWRFFVACLRGGGASARPSGSEKLKTRAYAYLIASAKAREPVARRRFARTGLAVADASAQPFVQILARVALGVLDDAGRDAWLSQARDLARAVDAPELRRAVDAVADGERDCGMLSAFADRYRRAALSIEVRAFDGAAACDGHDTALSDRERQLLVALALAGSPVSRENLVERLWSDRDLAAGSNGLKVYATRLRRRFGDRAAIVVTADGYALGPNVTTDLVAIARALDDAPDFGRLTPDQRSRLSNLYERAVRPIPESMLAWPWFGVNALQLGQLAARLSRRLYDDAVASGDSAAALVVAKRLVAFDPYEEAAREMLIRAQLAAGDRAAASRELRDFGRLLEASLGVDLPQYLRELVG